MSNPQTHLLVPIPERLQGFPLKYIIEVMDLPESSVPAPASPSWDLVTDWARAHGWQYQVGDASPVESLLAWLTAALEGLNDVQNSGDGVYRP